MRPNYGLCLFLLESLFLVAFSQDLQNPSCSFQDPSGYAIAWGVDQQQQVDFYLNYQNFPNNGGFWTGIGFGSTNQLNAVLVETQNGQVVVSPARVVLDLPPQRNSPLMNADGFLNGRNLQSSFSVPIQVIMSMADDRRCIQFSFFTTPTRSDIPWNGQAITRMICNLSQCIQPFSLSYSQYGNNRNNPFMQSSNNFGVGQFYNPSFSTSYPSSYNQGYNNAVYMPQNYGYNQGYNPGYGVPYGYDQNSDSSDFVIENPNYQYLPNYLNDQYARNYQMQQASGFRGFGNFMNGRDYGFMNPPILNNVQQNQANYQDIRRRSQSMGNQPYYVNSPYGYDYNTPQNMPYGYNQQYQPYQPMYGQKKRQILSLDNLIRIVKRQAPGQEIYYPYRTDVGPSKNGTRGANSTQTSTSRVSDSRNNGPRLQNSRCSEPDPNWCEDYVANFMEWKTKHEAENAPTTQATCKQLIDSLQNSHHSCCQAVHAAGCYII